MRAVWDGIINEWRSVHLLVRMHLLRRLFARNEKRLPELRWRTGAPTAAAGRGIVDRWGVIRRASNPADLCMALRRDLFALNPHLSLRVERHLLPGPAVATAQRTLAFVL